MYKIYIIVAMMVPAVFTYHCVHISIIITATARGVERPDK